MMDGQGAGVVLDAPRPVRRLGEALLDLLDESSRASMSAAARRVAQAYPLEENFRATLQYLEQVAAERKKH